MTADEAGKAREAAFEDLLKRVSTLLPSEKWEEVFNSLLAYGDACCKHGVALMSRSKP